MFEFLTEDTAQVLVKLFSGIYTAADGSSLPYFLLHVLHSPHIAVLLSVVSCELLLGPAVRSVPGVGRGPGTVPAEVDVRLAAVLHWTSVLGLVHQAGHVRHADLGGELVDGGGVTALAGPARPAVDDGLGREGEVG